MLSILNRLCNNILFIPLFNICSLIVVLLISVFVVVSCSKIDKEVVATVGDYDITLKEFEDRYSSYIVVSGVEDSINIRKAILNNMINEILLKHYDDNKAIYENDEYKKEKEWLYKTALIDFLKEQEIYGNIEVADKEIREAFDKMNQTLTARYLHVLTKEEADRLYESLQAGASFETLAKQVFTDSTLRNNGGYIGSFSWGNMEPALEDAAYALDIGEISKPVKTKTGYCIIKLESKEYDPPLTEYQYLQKKPFVLQTIRSRKKNPTENTYIKSLFDKDKLKINKDAVEEVSNILTTAGFNSEKDKQYQNKLVASYGDEKYYTHNILSRIENQPEIYRKKITSLDSIETAIEKFVKQDILLVEAEDKGYDKSETMIDKYNAMLNNLFMQYKMEQVSQNTSVDDSTLLNYYRDHIDIFSTDDEVNIQEIIVKDKRLASDLMHRIKNGEDFGKLAAQYSLREWSAKNKGKIGFTSLNKFGALKPIFGNSSVGELIGPRKIDGYYCLFKVLGKKESKPIEFNSIRSEVLKVFREDRQPQLLQKHINQIRSVVNIIVDDDMLGSLNISLLN